MIVFDLICSHAEHVFEVWFSSSSAYEDQRKKRLILCPVCGDTDVSKALMAPHIGAKGNRAVVQRPTAALSTEPDGKSAAELKQLFTKIAEIQAEKLKDSTWVGKDFERQARAIDAGEQSQTLIHGQATPEQAREMAEDGIAVMPLLIPIIPPEEQN